MTTQQDPLNLSDEEFANFDWASFTADEEPAGDDNEVEHPDESSATESESTQSSENEIEDVDGEPDTVLEDVNDDPYTRESTQSDDSVDSLEESSDETDGEEEGEEEEDEVDEIIASEEESPAIDYKEEYEKLFSPFKANGRMMQIESVEDARTLMQMGANYNKKMAALKPNLKIVKMLENNGLLDENKISYLIDLNKNNPEAVKKLIKDSSIDVEELDLESEQAYQPKSYAVDDSQLDKELAIDEVLSSIKDTPTYHKTLDIIANKWDARSKQIIQDDPVIIEIINEHLQNGIYDQIHSVMERERMLGRLRGMSDIDAYKTVGDALHKAGKFGAPAPVNDAGKPDTVTKPSKTPDPKLVEKRKAAAITKGSVSQSKANAYNPLSMSDEEFEKIQPQYI